MCNFIEADLARLETRNFPLGASGYFLSRHEGMWRKGKLNEAHIARFFSFYLYYFPIASGVITLVDTNNNKKKITYDACTESIVFWSLVNLKKRGMLAVGKIKFGWFNHLVIEFLSHWRQEDSSCTSQKQEEHQKLSALKQLSWRCATLRLSQL